MLNIIRKDQATTMGFGQFTVTLTQSAHVFIYVQQRTKKNRKFHMPVNILKTIAAINNNNSLMMCIRCVKNENL